MRTVVGIDIGTEALTAATYSGTSPVSSKIIRDRNIRVHPAVVTWSNRSAASVGQQALDAERRGAAVFRHFIHRVGDPVHLIADDGTRRSGESLLAAQLATLVNGSDTDSAATSDRVAVILHPSVWSQYQVRALREALAQNHINTDARRVEIVPRSAAVLAWMRHNGDNIDVPSLLCDAGPRSIEVTAVDEPRAVDRTLEIDQFGSQFAEQALFQQISQQLAGRLDNSDRRNWPEIRALQNSCRRAVLDLSRNTSTTLTAESGGESVTVRIVRAEFEELIGGQVDRAAETLVDFINNSKNAFPQPKSIVLSGEAALIPLVSERLSAHAQIPVRVIVEPHLAALRGAVQLGLELDLPRVRMRPAQPVVESPAPSVGSLMVEVQPSEPAGPILSSPIHRVARIPTTDQANQRSGTPFWTRGRKLLASAAVATALALGGAAVSLHDSHPNDTTSNVHQSPADDGGAGPAAPRGPDGTGGPPGLGGR